MMQRILYLYRDSGHHYKELDFQILSSAYEVQRFPYRYDLRSFRSLRQSIRKADLVYAWFASPFAAIAVMFAKRIGVPSVIVAGGFDVADYRQMRHGARHRILQRRLIRSALQDADLVLPVSEFNQAELLSFSAPRKHQMIYNGVDIDPERTARPFNGRSRQVVTVGAVHPHYSKLKGHFHFAEIAKRVADADFILAGPIQHRKTMQALQERAEGRIRFTDRLTHTEVIKCFQQSRVYLQLSYYESFGMTVPEAMACGCFPIVSRCGALPEVVGTQGAICQPDDYDTITDHVKSALATAPDMKLLRQRADVFSAENRQHALLKAISETLKT